MNQFPHLNLEDKLHLEGEGNVATRTGEQADSNNGKNLVSRARASDEWKMLSSFYS